MVSSALYPTQSKRMKALAVLLLFGFILSLSITSQAHAFRCQGGSLVLVGDTSFEVKRLCGEPADTQPVGWLKVHGRKVYVERYFYVPGRGSFLRIIELHDGIVASITRGRRVK